MATACRIRPATEADLPRIHAIYNDAILTTTATWDDEPWPWERRIAWWNDHLADRTAPVLVADVEGTAVAGFAYLSWYRPKSGYRFTRESTVYIHPDCQRRGLGRALVAAVVREANELGLHALLAVIDGTNEASIALHRQLGFEEVAREREIGFKFGRWLDCVTMELLLARSGSAPS